jgi:hypothetical protein
MAKSGSNSFHKLKENGVKVTAKDIWESGTDTLVLFKVLPARVKLGFAYFKDDLIYELDHLPDQKQKTIFSLKVIGALSSFTLGIIYNVNKGKTDFSMKGLKRRTGVTQFIAAEIIFKISQLFVYRFLNELEKEVTVPEDLKNIRYFKDLVSSRAQMDTSSEYHEPLIEGDPAITIVENLKHFISTGNRVLKDSHDS